MVVFVLIHPVGTREAHGQTGYITAINMATGELLWRSAAQVANTEAFVVDAARGVIVSAFGYTSDPRIVYVLDASTGVTLQKIPVAATPQN